MKLVLIPSGEFDMGSTDEMIENDCHTHSADEWYLDRVGLEWPMHHVRITRPLYLGVYDVTQEQYERVMRENPSYFSPTGGGKDQVAGRNTRRYPVECVSFDDALAFCRRLSILPDETIAGRAYRLPSEAEWEYACRAGNPGRCYFSVGSKPTAAAFDEQHAINFAWYEWGGSTHEVGQRSPNAWGLYDMNGNVFQWCQDVFARNYFSQSPVNDPPGPADGYFRVNRGGGAHGWYFSRSAFRQFSPPTWRFMDLGFRVCFLPASNHLSRPTQPPQIRGLQKKLAPAKNEILGLALEYEVMGQLEKAIVSCSKAMEQDPTLANDIEAVQMRGEVALRLARWHDAAVDFTKMISLSGDKQLAQLRAATLCLLAGDESSYRRVCHEMLAEASRNQSPEQAAKACLLLPLGGDDLIKADRLATEVVKGQPDVIWNRLVQGIADCRSARYSAAVAQLNQTIEKNAAPRFESLDAVAHLFLSLAHQGQGHRDEAKKHLESGRQLVLEEARAIRQRGFRSAEWDTWIVGFYIYAEAVHLVEGTPEAQVHAQLDEEIRTGGNSGAAMGKI